MLKREMKMAAEDRWQVVDDFGCLGTVVGLDIDPSDGEFKLLVLWQSEKQPHRVHHARANRVEVA